MKYCASHCVIMIFKDFGGMKSILVEILSIYLLKALRKKQRLLWKTRQDLLTKQRPQICNRLLLFIT